MAKNYGPGSTKVVNTDNHFKTYCGVTENKRRPESVFINISTWAKPILSVVAAKQLDNDESQSLTLDISRQFRNTFKTASNRLAGAFDTTYFDPASMIYSIDYATDKARPGKALFFELEINIDTTNDIDNAGNPGPGKNGKINEFTFDQLIPHIVSAVNKILSMDIFKGAKMEFSQYKPAGAITESKEDDWALKQSGPQPLPKGQPGKQIPVPFKEQPSEQQKIYSARMKKTIHYLNGVNSAMMNSDHPNNEHLSKQLKSFADSLQRHHDDTIASWKKQE